MIFTQFRESVAEIASLLNHFKPAVRCMAFVGQSGASAAAVGGGGEGKGASNVAKGLTQKEQLEVIRRFKDGGYNTLGESQTRNFTLQLETMGSRVLELSMIPCRITC